MPKTIKYLLWGALIVALIAFGTLILPRLTGTAEPTPPITPVPSLTPPAPSPETDPEQAVRDLAGAFGARLKEVSLLAPADTVRESIEDIYGPYVSPRLLDAWLDDPASAPGRLVSSPWPDRIDIRSVSALSETAYEVKGEIIEVTGEEADTGAVSAKRPVTLWAAQVTGEWRITGLELGPYQSPDQTVYTDDAYGFRFALPRDWEGYSIITGTWAGFADGDDEARETGPVISIRHPLWTKDIPRQDIPIMVFTLAQWEALHAGAFSIGAASTRPAELGRNQLYVFALSAGYDREGLPGRGEVDAILKGDPLEPIEPVI